LRNQHARQLRESSHPGTVPVAGPGALITAFARVRSAQQESFTKDSTDRLLLNWVISSNQAFTAIEHDSFRELIEHIQPKYKLPKSADTIRSWVITNYNDQKNEVRLEINSANTQIHLSVDGWTSPHQSMSVIGVVAHFTSSRGARQNLVLALREIQGAHTGEALADIVVSVIKEYDESYLSSSLYQINRIANDNNILNSYNFLNNVGYFQMDNAGNNGTRIRSIARMLMDHDVSYNPENRRLRCMGHVLNLSITAFWFGDLAGLNDLLDVIVVTDETMAQWRKIGQWGKAHNITAYIRSSVQRKQQLRRLGAETLLQASNATRWNSGLSMIQSLLRNQEAVHFFCLNNSDLEQDTLTEEDWIELQAAVRILQPFLRSTLALEGKAQNLWEVIPEIDYLASIYLLVISLTMSYLWIYGA